MSNVETLNMALPLKDCEFKWRYRKVYPGTFQTPAAPLPLSQPRRPRRPTPSPSPAPIPQSTSTDFSTAAVARPMDPFRQFNDSVQDVWSTEDPEDVDVQPEVERHAGLVPAEGNFNGLRTPGRMSATNRYSSEHLRAKGLQRLAMQAQGGVASAGKGTRPGLAVRSVSMGFPLTPTATSDAPLEYSHTSPLEVLPRQTQKADKFLKLLAQKSFDLEDLRKISWSGIPVELRGRIWRILCGIAPPVGDAVKVAESLKRKRDEYGSLVQEYYPKREDEQYKDTFRQIHIDVPRMCPLVPLFQQTHVQELFERVLFIWAIRNPASGYVQGINDLVTPYFMVYLRDYIPVLTGNLEDFPVATLPSAALAEIEADSFWCLSKLLSSIQNNYTFAQPGIQQRVLQLKDLIQRVDGELHRHLERCTVEYLQFSFRWMNNLLIRELPLNCVIRLWDSYHSEVDGFAGFHVYVCASFLLWWSEDLRQQADFQHALLLLQNLPTQNWGEDEVARLLARAFMLKYAFADAPRHLKSN
ncbi:TBC1 domain family member 22B-like [Paramacrobiotus metropolitanus]|uniref:TBC1 domain family member 22B-like n=1 Tax=Paramacrobiotus metropolitanus TaxID=2943436 RepID=UPI0024464426|nr:TBC1 domain family member 22B-like [Paramacrobiotus metropolitanus]